SYIQCRSEKAAHGLLRRVSICGICPCTGNSQTREYLFDGGWEGFRNHDSRESDKTSAVDTHGFQNGAQGEDLRQSSRKKEMKLCDHQSKASRCCNPYLQQSDAQQKQQAARAGEGHLRRSGGYTNRPRPVFLGTRRSPPS